MTIYVASPWKYKNEARMAAAILRWQGHIVVSRWHDLPGSSEGGPATQLREAQYDVEDMFRAQALLVLNLELSEGKAVEQGIAIARGIPVVVIGPRTNVFHYLPVVQVVSDLLEAIRLIESPAFLYARIVPSETKSACDR